MVESGRVPEKGSIWVSTGNGRIQVSTGEGLNLGEYRKRVEFGGVPEKGRIRASTEKGFGRVPEKVESR